MGVYIKGMEMPKNRPQLLWVYPNGKVLTVQSDVDPWKELQAVPVPPHGRLIEYHAAVHAVYDGYKEFGLTWRNAEVMLGKLPTIIPAEEGE